MDKTNILEVFEELSDSMADCNLSINFTPTTEPTKDDPSVLITAIAPKSIVISFYMTAEQSQEITKEELESYLRMLIRQEQYRRKIIFKTATLSTTATWE